MIDLRPIKICRIFIIEMQKGRESTRPWINRYIAYCQRKWIWTLCYCHHRNPQQLLLLCWWLHHRLAALCVRMRPSTAAYRLIRMLLLLSLLMILLALLSAFWYQSPKPSRAANDPILPATWSSDASHYANQWPIRQKHHCKKDDQKHRTHCAGHNKIFHRHCAKGEHNEVIGRFIRQKKQVPT